MLSTQRLLILSTLQSPQELRICTNRTCLKQGSLNTLQTLTALAPPNVTVKSCGCLGQCGAGPNVAVLPEGVIVRHCGTAAKAAELMVELCGGDGDDVRKGLEGLALRKRAEKEKEKGELDEAERLLTEAIDLNPFGGIHTMYTDRSLVRLTMGKYVEALEDTKQAVALAPCYPEAYICQGDVLLALGQFDASEKSYSMALQLDPSIRRSKSFKGRITKLQEKLTAAEIH